MAGAEVSFSSVSKTYRTGAGLPVRALAEVTLDIPAGQAVAVTGRSGSASPPCCTWPARWTHPTAARSPSTAAT